MIKREFSLQYWHILKQKGDKKEEKHQPGKIVECNANISGLAFQVMFRKSEDKLYLTLNWHERGYW